MVEPVDLRTARGMGLWVVCALTFLPAPIWRHGAVGRAVLPSLNQVGTLAPSLRSAFEVPGLGLCALSLAGPVGPAGAPAAAPDGSIGPAATTFLGP